MAEIMTLTLPFEPRLSRLGRLTALHFFKHNGVAAGAARKRAIEVETACRRLLRRRTGSRPATGVILIRLIARGSRVEVIGGGSGRRPIPLLSIPRPALR